MTAARATAREVHLTRVEAAARYLCEETEVPWEEAEYEKQNSWRWVAEQALAAAELAAGRTKTRRR